MERGVVVGTEPIERWHAPPGLVLGLAGTLVAAVLLLVAAFPRTNGGALAEPAPQGEAGPGLAEWRERYEAFNRAPVGVDAPLELAGGHRLTSLSVWRPGLYVEGTVWHWMLIGADGGWLFVSADPTSRFEERSDEAVAIPSLAALRTAAGEELVSLEWNDAGFTVRIEGSGLPTAELENVAAGVRLPAGTDESPQLGHIPGGYSAPRSSDEVTVGPSAAGWYASYAVDTPAEGSISIVAAEDAMYPFSELYGLAPDNRARIRGYWGLAFEAPAAAGAPLTVRSRLLWFEEGALLEATSDTLSAAELQAALEPLELRHPEARVLRTSVARSLLGFGRRGAPVATSDRTTAAELLEILDPPGR